MNSLNVPLCLHPVSDAFSLGVFMLKASHLEGHSTSPDGDFFGSSSTFIDYFFLHAFCLLLLIYCVFFFLCEDVVPAALFKRRCLIH